jgi:triosephosphate isomerase
MQKLLIANWKENPKTEKEAVALFGAAMKAKTSKGIKTIICPPFVYLEKLSSIAQSSKGNHHIAIGAQDVFWENEGPYTGEISPAMLKDAGVGYVIIGHSERRRLGETDAMVNKKIRAALSAGLRVVLCVGESAEVRKKGIAAAQTFVKNQLAKDLKGISRLMMRDKFIIAYEPIWAIGTGRNANPDDARIMAIFIKQQLTLAFHILGATCKVLYGGSVSGRNIGDYIQYKEVDGALVGGASLKAAEWRKIIEAVAST